MQDRPGEKPNPILEKVETLRANAQFEEQRDDAAQQTEDERTAQGVRMVGGGGGSSGFEFHGASISRTCRGSASEGFARSR